MIELHLIVEQVDGAMLACVVVTTYDAHLYLEGSSAESVGKQVGGV